VPHILAKITPNIALWPGLDPNPLRSYLDSLDKLAGLKTAVALPGHRAVIHDVPGRVAELREHHRIRAQACWDAAGDAGTAYEICLKVFPRLKSIDDVRMAMVETLSHLEYLASEGRLGRSEGSVIWYRQVTTQAVGNRCPGRKFRLNVLARIDMGRILSVGGVHHVDDTRIAARSCVAGH
jgi:hypothetical protein